MQIPKSSSASGNVRCVRLALAVRPVFRSMAEGVGDQSSSHRHRLAYQTSSPPAHLSSRASRLSQRSSPLAPTAHPIISLGETREVRRFSNLPPLQHATPISPEPSAPHVTQAAPISTDEYHALSDSYIDNLVAQLEEMQEEREEVDVEYSAGVLTLNFPPHGTYVLNKQPPNKQIWLSSPVSGPKRYDWVLKPDTGDGQWIYLRDGSTLSALLEEEVGAKMDDNARE